MIGQVLQNRYKIEEEIGRGGMGTVYRAQDSLLKRPVAIKVISDNDLGSTGKARLLAEAQAAARLNHPNIVSVYDAGEVGNLTYLVMELVEGLSLRQAQVLPLQQVLEVSIQVCRALQQAHANGIIHRDLKPENIMLTPSKIAKLMDFGLARQMDTPQLTEEGAIVGTFAYIAPEIISGGQASPQSDLYALGLILYEMATGRPAYSGKDLITILSQHLHATVEPPSTHNPQITNALETLILHLLEKQPGDRPASAADVLASLEVLRAGGEPEASGVSSGSTPLDRIVRGRMVAREAELNEAIGFWRRAQLGESRVLLISGEPGIGKTRLAREMATRIGLAGGLTLFGESYAQGGAPYAPIAQIIDQADLSDLPPLVLADLCVLNPGLGLRMPDLHPNPALDPQAEQQRLLEAFATLCGRMAQRAPLLVVLDDAHWADGGTLSMLHYLARRAQRMNWPVLLVLTYREVELSEARYLNDLLVNLIREHLSERIKLNRFSREQTFQLLAAIFAEPVSDEFCDSIYRETEGNPFFVEEVCKTLIDEGLIYRVDGHWERAEMGEMHVPQSVRVAIEGRIARLPEPRQETLRLAAVFGRRFDFQSLQQASEQSEDELIDALEQAERLQLLSEVGSAGGGVFFFTHALIPTTLVEGLSGLRRRRLHRKALEVVSRLTPDDYETLANHCVQAAEDALALEYYTKAAQRAHRLYALRDALHLYTEALSLAPQGTLERFKLLQARVAANDVLANRPEQLVDLQEMLQIARTLGDRALECDALTALCGHYMETDQYLAKEPGDQALALARELSDQAREGRVLSVLARYAIFHVYDGDLARQYFDRANACLEEVGNRIQIGWNLNLRSLLEGREGNFEPAQRLLEQAMALSRELGDRRLEGTNLRRIATNLSFMDRHAEALVPARQALELYRQIGDRGSECHSLNIIALCLDSMGQPVKARGYYEQAMALGEEIDLALGIYYPAFNMVESYFPRIGELEQALAFIDEQVQRPQFISNAFMRLNLLEMKGSFFAILGRYEEALNLFRQEMFEDDADAERRISTWTRLAYLLGETGKMKEAEAAIEEALRLAEKEDDPKALGFPLWSKIFYFYRVGTPEALHRAVAKADALLETLASTSWAEFRNDLTILKALCQALLGEQAAALRTVEPVCAYLAAHPRPYRYDVYLRYGMALRLAGQPEQARPYIQAAADYVALVADKLSDQAARQRFLETRDVRDVLTEAAALGI